MHCIGIIHRHYYALSKDSERSGQFFSRKSLVDVDPSKKIPWLSVLHTGSSKKKSLQMIESNVPSIILFYFLRSRFPSIYSRI